MKQAQAALTNEDLDFQSLVKELEKMDIQRKEKNND
jgi:hypothetical protein